MVVVSEEAINQFQSLMDKVEEPLKKTFQNVHQGHPTEALERFLKAREGNVSKGHKMLVDCLNWRVENKIDDILAKPIVPTDFYRTVRDSQLIGLSGYTREGLPVFAIGAGLSTFDKASVHYYVQSHIQINEYRDRVVFPSATKKFGKHISKCVKVLDMTGLKMSHLSLIKLLTIISGIDDLNYPEKTVTYYIVNVPYIFSAFWKVVKPLLQERTRNKVQVLSGRGRDELLKLLTIVSSVGIIMANKQLMSSSGYGFTFVLYSFPSNIFWMLQKMQDAEKLNEERRSFDEKFIRNTKRLCELTSAADSLHFKSLVDLTSRALARMIEGKTPDEIRETFHLPDDLTEEEKLEPLKNTTDDPRIRLLNRLYARKRKELIDRQKLKNAEAEVEHEDDRSVDDLLSFINGKDGDSKVVRSSKNKKKNRKRKNQQKNPPLSCSSSNGNASSNTVNEIQNKVSNGSHGTRDNVMDHDDFLSAFCEKLRLRSIGDDKLTVEDEFDDCDVDDEIDPALKEKLDREVEDFARRLNSDWPERMQEIFSSGQESRPSPVSSTGTDPSSNVQE